MCNGDHYHQTVRTFGGLDILVSNAAVNPSYGSTLDVSQAVNLFVQSMHVCPSLQTEGSAWDKVCLLLTHQDLCVSAPMCRYLRSTSKQQPCW